MVVGGDRLPGGGVGEAEESGSVVMGVARSMNFSSVS